MSKDMKQTPDPHLVEKLLENIRRDAELEADKEEIDMQTAELSEKWAEANARGDTTACGEIERRMKELDRARDQIG